MCECLAPVKSIWPLLKPSYVVHIAGRAGHVGSVRAGLAIVSLLKQRHKNAHRRAAIPPIHTHILHHRVPCRRRRSYSTIKPQRRWRGVNYIRTTAVLIRNRSYSTCEFSADSRGGILFVFMICWWGRDVSDLYTASVCVCGFTRVAVGVFCVCLAQIAAGLIVLVIVQTFYSFWWWTLYILYYIYGE